jgi:hypothetical protein
VCSVAVVVVVEDSKKNCNLLEDQLVLGDWRVKEHNWEVALVVAAVGMIVAVQIELHCWRNIRKVRNSH